MPQSWYSGIGGALYPGAFVNPNPGIVFSRYSNKASSRLLHDASVFGTVYVWVVNGGSFSSGTWYLDGISQGLTSSASFPLKGLASNGGGRVKGLDTTALGEGFHLLEFRPNTWPATGDRLTAGFYVFNTVDSTTLPAVFNSSANSGQTITVPRGHYDIGSPGTGYYSVNRSAWTNLLADGDVIVTGATLNILQFRNNPWLSFQGPWRFVGVGISTVSANHLQFIADSAGRVWEIDLNQVGGLAAITSDGSATNPSTDLTYSGLATEYAYVHHGAIDWLDPYRVINSTYAYMVATHFQVFLGQAHGDGCQMIGPSSGLTLQGLDMAQQNTLLQQNFGPSKGNAWTDVYIHDSDRNGFQVGSVPGYWSWLNSLQRVYSFGHGIGPFAETTTATGGSSTTLGAQANPGDATITLASNPWSALALPYHVQIGTEVLIVNSWSGTGSVIGTLDGPVRITHANGSTVTNPNQPLPIYADKVGNAPIGLLTGPPPSYSQAVIPIRIVGVGTKAVAAGGTTMSLTQSGNGNAFGRLMLVVIGGVSGQTVTPPAGWTAVAGFPNSASSGQPVIWAYYRVRQSGDASSWNFTLGGGTSHGMTGAIYNLNGVDTAAPFDAIAVGTPAAVGAGANVTIPTASATYGGSMRIRLMATSNAPTAVLAGTVDSTTDPVTVSVNAVPGAWSVGKFLSLGQEKVQITAIPSGTQLTLARALEQTQKTTHAINDVISGWWTRPSYLAVSVSDVIDLTANPTSDGVAMMKAYEPFPLDCAAGDVGSESVNFSDAASVVTATIVVKATNYPSSVATAVAVG